MIAIGRHHPVALVELLRGGTGRDWRQAGAFRLEGLPKMRQEKETL